MHITHVQNLYNFFIFFLYKKHGTYAPATMRYFPDRPRFSIVSALLKQGLGLCVPLTNTKYQFALLYLCAHLLLNIM